MSREKQQILFKFPIRGINRVSPKNEQPELTCHDAQNVRPYDQLESRERGGSRAGLVKYSTSRQSANRVQDLNYVTTIANTLSATSLSRRTIIPVMVTNGVIGKFNSTVVTNATVTGTSALGNATQSPFAHSAELFQRLYYCDGRAYKIYVGSNNTATDWTPTAGSLPGDIANTIVCRLIEQWRGRIVLSGLATDPHNWFMSKLGDPLDWDYLPATETELDAVQGGAGFVGKVPDIINAIVPYNDDVLLFGCDHSIWMMSGDPQAGGRLDLVTDTVGMAFGRPYTQLPDGTLVFMSNSGSVYRMAPGGGKPQSITNSSIDPLIVNTNLNTNIVRMVYDEGSEGIHLFITPLAGNTNTTHWYYDIRNTGWFKVVFPDNLFNPVSMMAFDGDQSSDRVIMLGGDDGYIRYYSSSAFQDDGQNFTSYVTMGPIVADKGRYPTVLTDVQFVMDDTAGNTVFELGVGDTAEAALADFAATLTGEKDIANATFNISAGKSINHNPRTRGYFQYFKIGTTTPTASWAIEYIQASYEIVRTSKGRVSLSEVISYYYPDDPPPANTVGLVGTWAGSSRYITQSGGFMTAITPYQNAATGIPVFLPVGNVTVTNSDALLNGRMSFGSNSTLNYLADNAVTNNAAFETDNGFITIVGYYSAAATVNNAALFHLRNNAGSTWKALISVVSNVCTFRIEDTVGAGNTSPAANATVAANTPVVLTFGSIANGPWRIWVNNTFALDHNLSQFWNDIDNNTLLKLWMFPGAANLRWTTSYFSIYKAMSNAVMYDTQSQIASYYGITLN